MKRSPIQRRQPLRSTGPARTSLPTTRCKAKGCRSRFVQRSMTHRACSPECAASLVGRDKEDKARKESRLHRAKLADSKPLSHWIKLTEAVVHAYIHARDRGLSCISCGTRSTVQWEAGHYLTKGARPEIRFDPRNISLQCHRCNEHLSGNQAAYRIGLVEKIGEAAVQELEGPHPAAHYTRERLAEIRKQFAAMTRQLKAQSA